MFTIIDMGAVEKASEELEHLSQTLPTSLGVKCYHAHVALLGLLVALKEYEEERG